MIRSSYFEPRALTLDDGDLVVLSCIRNELARLPYFLHYYRERGVDRFLCVDNGSNDGSAEFLREQPDVEVFTTRASYRGSAAGRLWLQELADTYVTGHWALTVDVDELLIYPGSEQIPLKMLCRYLDQRGLEGLFTVMLDMYAAGPISGARYTPGTPFLETCAFFETDSYSLRPDGNPPFLHIFGGPRGRLYVEAGEPGPGPWMKKVPLVKWLPGFSYIRSTHTHRYIPLADITGALLHFKFFASFEEGMLAEYRRGDRRQNTVYARYVDQISPDTSFFGPWSHRYVAPSDLVARGVMTSSRRWRAFCSRIADRRRSSRRNSFEVADLLPEPPAAPTGLEQLATVWPFVNNPGLPPYFGLELPGRGNRLADLIAEMRLHVEVVEIEAERTLLRVAEPALHRWGWHGLSVVLAADGRVVGVVAVDGSDESLELDTDTLEPNICVWPVGMGAALAGASSTLVTAHLVDGGDPGRPLPAVGQEWEPGEHDAVLLACRWHPDPRVAAGEQQVTGQIEALTDGVVSGTVYDAAGRHDVPVNVYVNGRLAVHTVATPPRDAPVSERSATEETAAVAASTFAAALPIGYFADLGATELLVEVRLAGTNLVLERSPLRFPASTRSATWDDGAGWQPRG